MGKNSKLLEDTKVDIRSVLLTAPKGLSLKNFCRDYEEIIGRPLPFRELGYRSPEGFLKFISDAVTITWLPEMNDYLLTAVANKRTSHIEKLVSKQRDSKQRGVHFSRKPLIELSQVYRHLGIEPTTNKFPAVPNKAQSAVLPLHQFQNKPLSKPFIPATTKIKMYQLIKGYIEGISLHNFLLAYRKKFGIELNYQNMGFLTLQDYLKSISFIKFCVVNGEERILIPDANSFSNQLNSSAKLNVLSLLPDVPPYSSQTVNRDNVSTNVGSISGISDNMKRNFRRILKMNPSGIWASDFLRSYERLTGCKLNLYELGYLSLIELTDALPHIFRRTRPEDCRTGWLLFDASVPESPSVYVAEPNDLVSSWEIIDEMIFNIRKILGSYPEGICIENFIQIYSLNCEVPLVLADLGFDSVENFLLKFAECVPLKFDYSNVRKKVLLDYCKPPIFVHPNNSNSRGILSRVIPSDAVLPGLLYEQQTIPPVSPGKYIPLYIGTITDPSLMWIQLVGKETSEALDTLMCKLQDCYTKPIGDNYIMQDFHVKVGTIAAGVWLGNGKWSRISIVEVPSNLDYVDHHAAYVQENKQEHRMLHHFPHGQPSCQPWVAPSVVSF